MKVISAMNTMYEFFKGKVYQINTFDIFIDYLFMHQIQNLGGGKRTRYRHDIVEKTGVIDELINENKPGFEKWIDYLKTTVYSDFSKHTRFGMTYSKQDFTDFYEMLLEAIDIYRDDEKRKQLHDDCYYNTSCGNKLPLPLTTHFVGADKLYFYYKEILETRKCEHCSEDDFACALVTLIYYLANGFICHKYYEIINGLDSDKVEYVNEVIAKYGTSGRPGIYAIYRLANRRNPNALALYEAGELEYYGRGYLSSPDYNAAFDYYKKAVEGEHYNPLAAWSLGYMYYHYHEPNHVLEHAYIRDIELQDMNFEDRVAKAIGLLNLSMESGCPASANVLAQISADARIPASLKRGLMNQLDYLETAANAGYTFSLNNLGEHYLALSEKTGDENFEKGFDYYRQSAELGEPYAMNKYAKYYLYDVVGDIEQAIAYYVKAAALDFEWAMLNVLSCALDEEQCEMLKRELDIHGQEQVFQNYLERLVKVCSLSNNQTIRNYAEEWKDKYECKS